MIFYENTDDKYIDTFKIFYIIRHYLTYQPTSSLPTFLSLPTYLSSIFLNLNLPTYQQWNYTTYLPYRALGNLLTSLSLPPLALYTTYLPTVRLHTCLPTHLTSHHLASLLSTTYLPIYRFTYSRVIH